MNPIVGTAPTPSAAQPRTAPAAAGLLVCVPTRTERRALRRGGLAEASLLLTGAGPSASRRATAGVTLRTAESLAVAGIGGGLDPALRPGDVVVATEIRRQDGAGEPDLAVIRCPAAVLVAATLRSSGLRVHLGPVISTDHVVTSNQERAALAATGALVVDMESAWLVADRADPVVVRVVADVAGEPLIRPATLSRLRTALAVLARTVPAMRAWAAAYGEHRVLLAGPRSFCAGVVRAIDIVDETLVRRGAPVYVRREIVHNRHVVADLAERGAVFVDELDQLPVGASVVFSAHGVAPAVRVEATARDLQVIDATCPLVSKVHAEVRRFADDGDTVLFIGHAGHEEAVGTVGERPSQTVLIEDVADAMAVAPADPERVSYLVQTTLAADEVAGIVAALTQRFPALRGPGSDDICYATTNRQRALRDVVAEADLCLVVGSVNSSNSVRLVEVAERAGTPARLIDDAGQLDLAWLAGVRTVALTAGASAPPELVEEVLTALRGLGPLDLDRRELVAENVHFTLPKELRRS